MRNSPFFSVSRFLTVVVISVVAVAVGFAAETRTWTSGKYKLEAEFVGLSDDGTAAILKTSRGQSEIPLAKLSQADRDRIAELTAPASDDEENPFAELAPETARTPEVPNGARGVEVVPADCVRRALLVGVDDYAKFADLKYAVADVELIRDKLLELGFKPENIIELKTGAPSDFLPTKANIEERLDALFAASGPDDMIFIEFSGHGFEIGGVAGFAPQDARPSGDANVVDVASTVSITDVIKRLKESESKFKLFVVDACRENPTLTKNASTAARALKPLDPPPGIVVLQSCGPTEYSFEDEKSGHGLFTSKLAEGLDGKADADGDGKITILDVVRYATTETSAAAKRDFNATQTPFFKADITDFELADDLRRDNLTREAREAGASLLAEADAAVKADDFETALTKIDEALKLNPTGETRAAWTAKRADVEATRAKWQKAAATANALATIEAAIKLESTPELTALKMEIENAISGALWPKIPNFTYPTKRIRISTSAELKDALDKLEGTVYGGDPNFDNVTLALAKGEYEASEFYFIENKTFAICGETGKAEDVKIVFAPGKYITVKGDSVAAFVGLDISGGDEGLYINDAARVATRACRFHDVDDGLFVCENATVDAEDCEIAKCGDLGVGVSSSAQLEMRRCKIRDCGDKGIVLFESARANVSDCEICDNGGAGVRVNGDESQSGTFRNNRLSGNKDGAWGGGDDALKRLTRIGNTPNE